MATDYTKVPVQIILDLINQANPSASLTTSLVTLGTPAVYSGEKTGNTQLTVSAIEPSSGYTGNKTVYYSRIDLSVVSGTLSKEYSLGDATKISDLIPEINTRYGINLTADDYIDADLPTFTDETPGATADFTVTAKAGALCWINAITLTLKRNDIPLSDVITTDELPGLVFTAKTK